MAAAGHAYGMARAAPGISSTALLESIIKLNITELQDAF